MERNHAVATPEQTEALEGMGFRQSINTGNWVALGADKAPRLMVYPMAYVMTADSIWIASRPKSTRKFPDPVSAAVWLLLEDAGSVQ